MSLFGSSSRSDNYTNVTETTNVREDVQTIETGVQQGRDVFASGGDQSVVNRTVSGGAGPTFTAETARDVVIEDNSEAIAAGAFDVVNRAVDSIRSVTSQAVQSAKDAFNTAGTAITGGKVQSSEATKSLLMIGAVVLGVVLLMKGD
jgi:hypothetical protein